MGTDSGLRLSIGRFALMAGDLVLVGLIYWLVLALRFQGTIPAFNRTDTLVVVTFSTVILMLALDVYNAYRDLHRPLLDLATACVLAVLISGLSGAIVTYVFRFYTVPRSVYLGALPLQMVVLILWRIPFVRAAKLQYFRRPVVVVAANPEEGQARNWGLPAFVHVSDAIGADEIGDKAGRYMPPHAMYVILPDVEGKKRQQVLHWAIHQQNEVFLAPDFLEILVMNGKITRLADRLFVAVQRPAIPWEYRAAKRVLDLILAVILLVVSSPIFVLVPIINRLLCPGPTFYRQERTGLHGERFTMIKFRSMVADAEEESGPVLASRTDDRVTPVGRLLRPFRLDELPQLFNVLRGEMSLVGPRPERPVFVEEFQKRNPYYHLRDGAKPGVTGLAQVMGRYGTAPDDKLRYDLLYIGSYSLWLDIRILIWTVQTMIFPQAWVDSPPRWVDELETRMITSARYTAASDDHGASKP